MAKAPAKQVSYVWSAGFIVAFLIMLIGAGAIVFGAPSATPTKIDLSLRSLKLTTQSGGALLLAFGAFLTFGLAKLLPKDVRVLNEGAAGGAPTGGLAAWRTRLHWIACLGLIIAAVVLIWHFF